MPLELGIGIFSGTTPQAVWPYLAALYPFNALAYQGTAIAWAAGSSTPRFLSSVMTRNQNLAPPEVSIQRPRMSLVPSA